jgi:crotonobetainyl-CoA:carnitine CoA-transferase CaiB-like acyl-CoA transferase
MSVTGHPGGEPTKVGVALLDVICGLYAANAIQAALIGRGQTGRGRLVTVSLFDAGVAALVNQAANHLLGGLVPGPMGNAHPNIVPYQLFRTKDRPLILAAGNDRLFARTCEVLGVAELARDERYATNESRVLHREELIGLLSNRLTTRPAIEWIAELETVGVPCALVRSVDEVFAAPEGAATIQDVDDPVRGPLRLVAEPIRIDGATPPVRMPPPRLGEHTEEILRELER